MVPPVSQTLLDDRDYSLFAHCSGSLIDGGAAARAGNSLLCVTRCGKPGIICEENFLQRVARGFPKCRAELKIRDIGNVSAIFATVYQM